MANKMDETSTTKVENVDDGQSVSEVAWRDSERTDQKAAQVVSAPSRPLNDEKTKFMVTRQKVDRERARWTRLVCE